MYADAEPAVADTLKERFTVTSPTSYSLILASEPEEISAAQRLRYAVFAEEMGAALDSDRAGTDVDPLDEFCDHILVRDDTTGEPVGTYRMLPPDRAAAAGIAQRHRRRSVQHVPHHPLRIPGRDVGRRVRLARPRRRRDERDLPAPRAEVPPRRPP